nr:Chain B, AEKDEL peptide [Homo sapiens]
AEKDEL